MALEKGAAAVVPVLPDGRLIITFRSIERDPKRNEIYKEKGHERRKWYSEGWIAWVGTYDDLKNGREGQYRIKIAHTYLNYHNDYFTPPVGEGNKPDHSHLYLYH